MLASVVGGCAWDRPMSTLVAHSDLAHDILGVYVLITIVSVIIALIVSAGVAWVLWRYRERPGGPLPAQVRGHTLLELAWTIGPALVLLIIAIPTIQVIFRTQSLATQANALQVTVRGWQWWWEFRYPTLDVVTANELHLPSGQTVVLHLEGPDVIHSFWVPRLGGKRDVIPGRHNVITLIPDTPGEYWGQCAEFCGTSHANMAFRVIVDAPADFERWVVNQRAPAAEPTGAAAEGKTVYAASACVGCHTVRGVSTGVLGPDLTHFGSRTMLGAGMLENTPDNVAAWVRDPTVIKPGVKMPALGLTPAQARAVAAYLGSLR
jgi:cytochrome c oxidase subunit II